MELISSRLSCPFCCCLTKVILPFLVEISISNPAVRGKKTGRKKANTISHCL